MDRVFRGIGSFSVKFRWFIIAAWVIAAVAVPHFLPSLASVTQGNNANFLPASAPSEQAATLAKPFGGSNEVPVLVLAARSSAPLAATDQTWLASLQTDLHQVKTVTLVRDLGLSTDGHAVQLVQGATRETTTTPRARATAQPQCHQSTMRSSSLTGGAAGAWAGDFTSVVAARVMSVWVQTIGLG